MIKAKKKIIGDREYVVLGSTIERSGFLVVNKKYTTTRGVVEVKNGKVFHPSGEITQE